MATIEELRVIANMEGDLLSGLDALNKKQAELNVTNKKAKAAVKDLEKATGLKASTDKKSAAEVLAIEREQKKLTAAMLKNVKIIETTNAENIKQRRVIGDVNGVLSVQTSKFDANGKQMIKQSNLLLDLNKNFANLRWAMVNLAFGGAAIVGLVAPFVVLGKNFADVEKDILKISAATGKASDDIKNKLLGISRGSVFSLKDISSGFLEINKAGFSAADATTIAANAQSLAIAGFSDLNTATELLVQTLNAYNMTGAEAGYVTDIISSVANKSSSDVETLGNALSYVSATASMLNIPLSELVGTLGILQSAGLVASKAGTSLNQAMLSLIDPSEEAKITLERLGVALTENGKQRNTIDILDDLYVATKDYSNQTEILATIFETRALKAVASLFNKIKSDGGTIEEAAFKMSELGDASDNLAIQLEGNANRISSSWNSLKNTLDTSETAGFFSGLITSFMGGSDIIIKELDRVEKKLLVLSMLTGASAGLAGGPVGVVGGAVLGAIGIGNTKREEALSVAQEESQYQRSSGLSKLQMDYNRAKKAGNEEDIKGITQQIQLLTTRMDLEEELAKSIDSRRKATLSGNEEVASSEDKNVSRLKGIQNNLEEIVYWRNTLISLTGKDVGLGMFDSSGMSEGVKNAAEEYNYFLGYVERSGEAFDINTKKLEEMAEAVKKSSEYWFDLRISMMKALEGSDVSKFTSMIEQVGEGVQLELDSLTSGASFDASPYIELIGNLYEIKDEAIANQKEIDTLEESQKQLEKAIAATTKALDKEKAALKDVEDQLEVVNKTISKLTSMRFKDQTATEKLISAGERWIKKEQLAERGITDAHAYIQEMLAKSEHGYYKLFDSVTAVNDAVADGKKTYDAWRETVSAFIEETVSSGNILGENVTGAIGRFQTMLLSTSKFDTDTDSNDKIEQGEKVVRNLRDAYDVYYGEMQDDVKYAVQEHEDAANGVAGSSESVVESLKEQWAMQKTLTDAVEYHKGRVSELTKKLDEQKFAYDGIKAAIQELIGKFNELIAKAQQAIKDVLDSMKTLEDVKDDAEGKIGKGGGSSNPFSTVSSGSLVSTKPASYESDYNNYLSNISNLVNNPRGMSASLSTGMSVGVGHESFIDIAKSSGLYQNDFVMRPGQAPVPFSPDDTIVGTKGESSGGSSVTIQNINVSGVSGNATDFAYELSRALKRELKAL